MVWTCTETIDEISDDMILTCCEVCHIECLNPHILKEYIRQAISYW
jgi:hypothetical protein